MCRLIFLSTVFLFATSCKEGGSDSPSKKPTKSPAANSEGSNSSNGDDSGDSDTSASTSGPLTVGGTAKLSGQSFTVVASNKLTSSDSELSGTGSVKASSGLGSIKSNNHFSISTMLSEGSVVKLVANSTDKLAGGVEITFQGLNKKLSVKVGGKDYSTKFSAVSIAKSVEIGVDIHNEEANPHVLIWVNDSAFSEESAKFNTEAAGVNLSRGTGTGWGLILTNAKVSSASSGAAKFNEEG
ncbi:MAG: hypothetical protein NT027_08245 [Proteobacteria bacterium]|nr:hypothetical protein [Pseudomonadota bacterium]